MRYRVFALSGFAAGFAGGAWVGRARYFAAMRRLRGFKDNPGVHATAGLLHAHAGGAVGSAKRAVTGVPTGPVGEQRPVGPAGRSTTRIGSPNGAGPEPGGRHTG